MSETRLNKIIRKYNIGLNSLVDFLKSKGANVDENPNAKVSDEYLPAIEKQFGKDLAMKEASEKVDIKLTEILEKTSGKKPQEDVAEEEYEPIRETIIKSNTFSHVASKPVSEPEPAPAPKPAVEVKPEPVVEVKPTPKPEPAPAPKPEPVAEVKPQPAPAPKPEPAPAPKPEPVVEVKPQPAPKPVVEEKPEPAVEVKPEPAPAPAPKPVVEEKPAAQPEPKQAEPQKVEKKAEDNATAAQPGLKILGKIELSQFDKKKKDKKRERINKGTQKVDVDKVGKEATNNPARHDNKGGNNNNNNNNRNNNQNRGGGNNNNNNNNRNNNNNNRNDQNGGGKGKNKHDRGQERFKPAMTEEEQEEMQKQIQKQVKETYARMNEGKKNNFGAKYRKEKRELASLKAMEEMEQSAEERKILKVTEFVTVNDLATLMNNTPVVKVISACMSLGLMVSINQRLDAETLVLVAEEFGYKVEFVTAEITEEITELSMEDTEEMLESRPPIITVMGHVDHGKTSLLDYIRKSNVIAGEAGGITQHIGAYNVKLPDGRRITFLDTPGHEAFTAMRARGAQLTDLAIIIIAADDAVMPQTVEAINHAQAAGVPMVFAINKIDKDGANSDKIYQQLAQMNILTEAWGGKYQCQEISAKKGLNVDLLLEKVLLETDMLELKANPNRPAIGAVIESSLDKGRGYLATILVQNGTLKVGDCILSGSFYGRVKSMYNERGQKVEKAGPSTPVSVLGLNGAPAAGEKFNVMLDEREAKNIATKREQLLRIQGIKTQKHMTLEEIGRRIAIGNFKELNVIVKGDVDGSVEALSDSLIKLSTEEVRVNVIHKAVGQISESDILLAEASDAVIIGFQVRPSVEARRSAEKEGIEIRLYSVIYDAINEVKDGIEGMLEPEKKEEITATAEVKQTFKISKIGTIAGSIIKDGKLAAKSKVRLIRDGIVIYTGELSSLQRGKDQAKEVPAGMECGIGIDKFNDIKIGDIIEAFTIVEIKRTL